MILGTKFENESIAIGSVPAKYVRCWSHVSTATTEDTLQKKRKRRKERSLQSFLLYMQTDNTGNSKAFSVTYKEEKEKTL